MYIGIFFAELFLLFLFSRALTKALSQLFFAITKSAKATAYILAILFLPGTFIHELAHFVMAIVLFVQAGRMSLLPMAQGDRIKLGSVAIAKTDPIRRFLIGTAPFLFGTAIILLTLFYATKFSLHLVSWLSLLIGYIVFEIGNTMFSSKKDMEGSIILLLFACFIFGIFYFLGFRFSINSVNFLFSDQITNLFKTGDLLFLLPIGINIVIITLLKFLSVNRDN